MHGRTLSAAVLETVGPRRGLGISGFCAGSRLGNCGADGERSLIYGKDRAQSGSRNALGAMGLTCTRNTIYRLVHFRQCDQDLGKEARTDLTSQRRSAAELRRRVEGI